MNPPVSVLKNKRWKYFISAEHLLSTDLSSLNQTGLAKSN